MYELKTLVNDFDIKLPTCMYSVKPYTLGGEQEKNCGSDNSNNMETLEVRQEKVIKQLLSLKDQLAGIRSQMGLCGKSIEHMRPVQDHSNEPVHDIVINAHPKYIPYGLLALKNTWKDIFNIEVKTFSHSTLLELTKEAEEFQKRLVECTPNSTKPNIRVTFIWKNCDHTEMISSPTMYVPIYGEVNILRYLGRVGPKNYRYEDSPLCNDIDAVLDICYQLLCCSTVKARTQLIRALNSRLQKQQYFGGEKISIADIAVCSTIKQMPQITQKDLTQTMNNWNTRVKSVTLI